MTSGGSGLPSSLRQLRLVVEQVELARRAGHEQVDDAPSPWPGSAASSARSGSASAGAVGSRGATAPHSSDAERDLADAHAAVAEEVAAGESSVHRSLLRDELVEVQDRPGGRGPGRPLGGVRPCRRRQRRRASGRSRIALAGPRRTSLPPRLRRPSAAARGSGGRGTSTRSSVLPSVR